jgi:hypothetical protein
MSLYPGIYIGLQLINHTVALHANSNAVQLIEQVR